MTSAAQNSENVTQHQEGLGAMPENGGDQVLTSWFWYVCPSCKKKIAVTLTDLEAKKNQHAKCPNPKCGKEGWGETNMVEATYSLGTKYGEKPK